MSYKDIVEKLKKSIFNKLL